MCKYCENEKTMMQIKSVSAAMIEWCGITKARHARDLEDDYGVFIDRGYLRLVDLDDCECLDHGKKLKINFCPVCGNEMKH